jgi:methylenetetrahydrofolate dehydrogenase (NADP+)/methenyltetrahydrofolate cyclohydrolase
MTAKIIDGRSIAKQIRNNLKNEVSKLKSKYDTIPALATVIIGHETSSEMYLKLRENACKEVGINTIYSRLDSNISEKEIIKEINELNINSEVHGILMSYPVPTNINQNNLMSSIDPKKDVEGFNPYNLGRTLLGNEKIIPCTPLSVLRILEYENEKIEGRDIVIINHSNIVGKPLAALLLNRNATVTVCHVYTKDLKKYSSKGEILISAIGKPKLLTESYIKENAFLIDVGISKTKDGVFGDFDFESVIEKASKITPVPGGVGPITITSSIENTIKLYKKSLLES